MSQTKSFNSNIGEIKLLYGFDVCVTPKTPLGWGNGRFIFNGQYWTNSGRKKREDVAAALSVSEQYLDAIEDMHKAKRDVFFEMLNEYVDKNHQELDNHYAEQYEIARDVALKKWRLRTPSTPEMPGTLKSVKHIKRLDAVEPCHVYFLLNKNEVVYVGKTSAPWPQRILNHIKEGTKTFDDVWYLEVDPLSLDRVEMFYIKHYRPKYNVSHNQNQHLAAEGNKAEKGGNSQ